MNTIDWSRWFIASDEEKREMDRRYREIVKAESDRARETGYRAVEAAKKEAGRKMR